MFSRGRFLYVRFIFPVIVPQSALSRVIAAWSGASAHPLALGPANRWQQMRERKSGRSRSIMPWPHLLPYLRSLRVCVPTARASLLPRSRDPYRHPHPLLVLTDLLPALPKPIETTSAAPHPPFSCPTGSFMLKKPNKGRAVPLIQDSPPPPSVRHSALCSGGGGPKST